MGRVDNKVGGNTPTHTPRTHEREWEREWGARKREEKKTSLACQLSPLPHKSTAIYFSFPVKVDRANIYPLARSL